MHALLIALHALAAVIWVGGMFFAYTALRPAAAALSLADRLPLWSAALGRFFLWVWASIAILLVTGYWMVFAYFGGFGAVGAYIHIMHALGWVMFLVFGHAFFGPWRRLRAALVTDLFDQAARDLNQIRMLVGVNLGLGLIVVAIATGGRYGLV